MKKLKFAHKQRFNRFSTAQKAANSKFLESIRELIDRKDPSPIQQFVLRDAIKLMLPLCPNCPDLLQSLDTYQRQNLVIESIVQMVFYAIDKNQESLFPLLFEELSLHNRVTNMFNYTPLHKAVINGNYNLVQYLCSLKANVNALSISAGTPLHLAIQTKNIPITKLLLDNNARTDIDDGNETGNTPLVEAVVFTKDREIVKLIYQKSTWTNVIKTALIAKIDPTMKEYLQFLDKLPVVEPTENKLFLPEKFNLEVLDYPDHPCSLLSKLPSSSEKLLQDFSPYGKDSSNPPIQATPKQ